MANDVVGDVANDVVGVVAEKADRTLVLGVATCVGELTFGH